MGIKLIAEVLNDDTMENISASGDITGVKLGVFAYLGAPTGTTITVASTYYPIAGTFTNAPSEGFGAGTVYTPSIKYSGDKTQYFEVDWHASFQTDGVGVTVRFGIKKNGTLVTSSVMGALCKTAAELYQSSGTCVVELAVNDEIQLIVTSDDAGGIVTVDNFTTTISEFFD